MRLSDLFEEQISHVDATEAIHDYTVEYHESENFERAVELLLQNPQYTHTGKMYRALTHESKDLREVPDVRTLLSKLQRHDQYSDRKYFSWSKTPKGMKRAMEINFQNEHIAKQWDDPVLVVYEQQGPALDVTAVLGNKVVDKSEEELIASIKNNMHVIGFSYSNESFKVSEFQELLKQIKA